MTSADARDPMLQSLTRLRRVSPDPARAERVRARCRARLFAPRRLKRTAVAEFARCIVPPVVVGSWCALYIAGLVVLALRLHGLFD